MKWCHRPCVYYANTTVSFHRELAGDLLFKLNPGSTNISGGSVRFPDIPVHTTNRLSVNNGYCFRCPNDHKRQCSSLINIPLIKSHQLTHAQRLKLCMVNAQSLRNKTADFSDYVTESKFDLVTLTKTWFTIDDVAMRALTTPEGYKLVDQPRASRSAGETGLLYRDSLQVTVVASGERTYFEFSEWLVVSGTYRLCVVVLQSAAILFNALPLEIKQLVRTPLVSPNALISSSAFFKRKLRELFIQKLNSVAHLEELCCFAAVSCLTAIAISPNRPSLLQYIVCNYVN